MDHMPYDPEVECSCCGTAPEESGMLCEWCINNCGGHNE